MTVHSFYRLAVWLPLAIPGLVALLLHGLGVGPIPSPVTEILLGSLIYGGLPYAPIAVWATFWIDNKDEDAIRRRAVRSPLWMIVSFSAFCAYLGVISRQLAMPVALFVVGSVAILVLGYLYVVLVFALRDSVIGQYQPIQPDSKWRW
jgi:hypothetical protein